MNGDFMRQFLAARDSGLSPQESWRRKPKRSPQEVAKLRFDKRLELLDGNDWELILMRAARSGERYVNLEYATDLANQDDAIRVYMSCYQSYVMPLFEAGAIGTMTGFPFRGDGTGCMSIALFAMKDRPEEDRRTVSREDVHRRLIEAGCAPAQMPKTTVN